MKHSIYSSICSGSSLRHERALNAEHFNHPSANGTVKIKSLLLTVLVFGLLPSSAFAQEGVEKKQFTRGGSICCKTSNLCNKLLTAIHRRLIVANVRRESAYHLGG